jgi:hypothetical protein
MLDNYETPSWIGNGSFVMADNFYQFQGANVSDGVWNQSVDTNQSYHMHNAYYSSGWKQHVANVAATMYQSGSGLHRFQVAPANSDADSSISWRNLLNINEANGFDWNPSQYDTDFKVRGDHHSHALFVEASTDRIGINTSSPTDILHIADGVGPVIKLECTDTSLSTDQVIGALQWRTNDPSGIGVADIGQIAIRSDSSVGGSYRMEFRVSSSSTANYEALRITRTGDITTTGADFSASNAGVTMRRGDSLFVTRTSGTALEVNRSDDGSVANFRSAGQIEGIISISGSTCTYGGFSGQHETSGVPSDIAVGTVVSTIDELDTYVDGPKAGQVRIDHAKVKVSNSVGDPSVYGVFSNFDESENGKAYVSSVGIGSVRVTGACSNGDLLESNGDGTAKVQSDDIVRSKTLGKVTIGNSNTGVKLVSCVLYCG